MPAVSLIAAIGRNRELGKGNDLLWHISADLKRFKRLTDGHPVIMGRKTWESLPEKVRPLPGRTNIVVTRDTHFFAQGAEVAHSPEEALAQAADAPGGTEIFVIGGAQLFEELLPRADRLYLTLIDAEGEADVFFPPYEAEFSRVLAEEVGSAGDLSFRWLDLARKS